MLEFAYHHRVDVNPSKITAIVKQFVHRHNCNAEVIRFLHSVSGEFARFEPCRLVLSDLAAVLLNDTMICLDLSGHELCKLVARYVRVVLIAKTNAVVRLHSEFTLSSEALRQLVERLQSLSNAGLSALLLLVAQNYFADETSAICFTAATQCLEKDMILLLELSVVAKHKPNATKVLDGCFARYGLKMFDLYLNSRAEQFLIYQ